MRKYLVGLVTAMVAMASGATSYAADEEAFRDAFLSGNLSYDDVLARAAEEGEVNWFFWGGSQALNTWVETSVSAAMAELGVKLNVTHITNTRDAVDLALAEKATGKGLGEGSVDAIWINGENFYTLAKNDLLFGSFAQLLPSSQYLFWDPSDARSGANLFDFGFPTESREMPWGAGQYICYIDTSRLSASDAPTTFAELEAWLQDSPGRFTYIAPPHFNGNTFVQEVMYAHNPDGTGHAPFMSSAESLGSAEIARLITPGFEYLKRIEPNLLGGSDPVYPKDQNVNETLVASGEVDMACRFGTSAVHTGISNGTLPPTTQNHLFPEGYMIGNKNFIGIPGNAPHPAAALVLANVLASPDSQISRLETIGYEIGIDAPKLSSTDLQRVADGMPPLYGVTLEGLGNNKVPDTNASLVDIIEGVWMEYIERGDTSRSLGQIVADVYNSKYGS
ncbi:MAG: ABC transporter substrate-binding protein [Acidiferrobacteraceae bacterium]|nr:ABC transporter substrate-binding protein [Acidiferrobacteraceae bacterium]|tara:strand:- start:2355 stop:3704 length:1350 start_codon:yes stop_codon:yes gene_type:complete